MTQANKWLCAKTTIAAFRNGAHVIALDSDPDTIDFNIKCIY